MSLSSPTNTWFQRGGTLESENYSLLMSHGFEHYQGDNKPILTILANYMGVDLNETTFAVLY